ncbi:MAG: hypothetical protein PVJ19_18745 [Desulfobacteraceae bacterium]|jgi:hypothetical protein
MTASQGYLSGRRRTLIPCLPGLLAGAVIMATTAMAQSISVAELQDRLPTQISGWRAADGDRTFDAQTIFSYIDGAGELYRAYNMLSCLSRRYVKKGETGITVDLFDMGTSEDAFGVFTHDTDGDRIDIGQDGRYRPGWLSFWQNRFYVSIYLEEESAAAGKAVKALGQLVASAAGESGSRPQHLNLLPQAGLDAGTIRYLHHPIVLNYHYYLFDENILLLSPQTDAILARYHRSGGQARLLLISYPKKPMARNALAGFRKYYLPDADSKGLARLENGKWSAVALYGRLLTIVLEADGRLLAKNLIREVGQQASGE